jgi:hypothetical protein
MFTLELNELRALVHDEEDKKTRAVLTAMLCLADKVLENSDKLEKVEKYKEQCEIFEGNASITCKILSGLGVLLFSVFVGIGAYIFNELKIISSRQSGVLSALEFIKIKHVNIDDRIQKLDNMIMDNNKKIQDIQSRNAAADNIQRDILNNVIGPQHLP